MTVSASSLPWTRALRLQLRQILITKGSSMLVVVLLAPLVILAGASSPTNASLEALVLLVNPVIMPFLVAAFWGGGDLEGRGTSTADLPARPACGSGNA